MHLWIDDSQMIQHVLDPPSIAPRAFRQCAIASFITGELSTRVCKASMPPRGLMVSGLTESSTRPSGYPPPPPTSRNNPSILKCRPLKSWMKRHGLQIIVIVKDHKVCWIASHRKQILGESCWGGLSLAALKCPHASTTLFIFGRLRGCGFVEPEPNCTFGCQSDGLLW